MTRRCPDDLVKPADLIPTLPPSYWHGAWVALERSRRPLSPPNANWESLRRRLARLALRISIALDPGPWVKR